MKCTKCRDPVSGSHEARVLHGDSKSAKKLTVARIFGDCAKCAAKTNRRFTKRVKEAKAEGFKVLDRGVQL